MMDVFTHPQMVGPLAKVALGGGYLVSAGIAVKWLPWKSADSHKRFQRLKRLAAIPIVLMLLAPGVFAVSATLSQTSATHSKYLWAFVFGLAQVFIGTVGADVYATWKDAGRALWKQGFVRQMLQDATRNTITRLPASVFLFGVYLQALDVNFTQEAFGALSTFSRISFDMTAGTLAVTMPVSGTFTLLFAEKKPLKDFWRDYKADWRGKTPLNILYWTFFNGIGLPLLSEHRLLYRAYFIVLGVIWSAISTQITRHPKYESRNFFADLVAKIRHLLDPFFPGAGYGLMRLDLHALATAA